MSDHEELESSVAAWVLGAVDEAEAEAIRSHVEGCASCRQLVGRLRRVASALPLAVEELNPPPRLRDRVLAGATVSQPDAPPTAVRVRRPEPKKVPAPSPAAGARRIPSYALAAVALIALLAGVIIGQIALRAPQPPAPSQVARFTMVGHQEMAGAQATVIELKSDRLALIDFRGLPPPGAGRVYEVWLIPAKGDPLPAAVFVPDSNGAKTVLINSSLAGYSIMAVTNEAGPDGARAPTQQPQLYGSVA